jgi:polyphosphate kinase 2 (PPK2 family)
MQPLIAGNWKMNGLGPQLSQIEAVAASIAARPSVEAREAAKAALGSDRRALLLLFQGTDAAGKDRAIRHVMSGVNPAGCEVFEFKPPSAEELKHDFLWRTTCRLPERGRIWCFGSIPKSCIRKH